MNFLIGVQTMDGLHFWTTEQSLNVSLNRARKFQTRLEAQEELDNLPTKSDFGEPRVLELVEDL